MPLFDQPLTELLAATTPDQTCTRIAKAVPLVHFPARVPFAQWVDWNELSSPCKRQSSPKKSAAPFDDDCWRFVYFYVGVSCYQVTRTEAHGDSVALFCNDALDRSNGLGSPFDTGAWLRQPPLLQPNAGLDADTQQQERAQRLREKMSVVLKDWRDTFAKWLAHCYEVPADYLAANGDLYADGTPKRTAPEALLSHNGSSGKSQYPSLNPQKPHHYQCCDRRAWTWELRCEDEVSFEHITHVIVLPSIESDADDLCNKIYQQHGKRVHAVVARAEGVQFEQVLCLCSAQQAQSMVKR
jgi:hypothetical protein